jgi:peptidyl-prolyl cis-trans isomerase D
MRRKKRLKIILWLVIISLALGMLLLFVPGADMGMMRLNAAAATVDGEDISADEFIQTYNRFIQSYSERGGAQLTPETLQALGVPGQAINALINVRVIRHTAESLGLGVSTEEIRRALETDPRFQENGAFVGVERYKAALLANRINVEEFEEGLRFTLLMEKVRRVVSDSFDITQQELRNEFAKENLEAQVKFVLFKKEDYKEKIRPTDEELKEYFEENKQQYAVGEERRAKYLTISVADMASTIEVTDAEIQARWDQNPGRETVTASHILFRIDDPDKENEVVARAETVLERAQAGEDFAGLAREFSEDESNAEQGGSLGTFPRGQMVREFEDAAFALQPGQVSGLVKSPFGYHIIWVTQRDQPTLESSRASLLRSIQVERATEVAKQKTEQLGEATKDITDLTALAEFLGVPANIKDTGLLARDADAWAAGITGPILQEMFRLKEINEIGRSIDSPTGHVIPQLAEVKLPEPPDFATSRDDILKDYVELKSGEMQQADVDTISRAAKELEDLEKAAQNAGLEVQISESFKRSGIPDPSIVLTTEFNAAAFHLPVGGISKPIKVGGGDETALLQVMSRTPFDEAEFENQKSTLRMNLLNRWRDVYFDQYIRNVTEKLERAGKIRINNSLIEQVTGLSS